VIKIYTGTSGYSYDDWKGYFYPEDISANDFLSYYCRIFNTVELNFTYYAIQKSSVFSNLLAKTGKTGDFIFSVKANSIFTHQRNYSIDDAKGFKDSLKPLSETGRLGCILFQFPNSFYFNIKNLNYVIGLGNEFDGFEISAEFRNSAWLNTVAIDKLISVKFGFCNVDEPALKGLLPHTGIATTDIGYLRFHGRNAEKWWNCEKAYQRYDYMYNNNEFLEWIPKVKEISSKTKKIYIYFNNHYKGKAAKSALMFMDILKINDISSG
jgi:uncharacterized protein YecE (DUF72 family)